MIASQGRQQERFDCVPGVDDGLPNGLHIDAGLFQQRSDERVIALHEVDEILYQQSKEQCNRDDCQGLDVVLVSNFDIADSQTLFCQN